MRQVPGQGAFDILRANFDAAYNGNRAPMPLFVHAFFLKHGSNLADVERFIGAAAALLGAGAQGCCSGPSPTQARPPLTCPAPPAPADYALAKPQVVFVTFRQLIAWLQHPVPYTQLTPKMLGCGNPGGRPGTLASKRRGRRRS